MNTSNSIKDELEGYLPQIRRAVQKIAKYEDVDDITQECCVRIVEKENLWKSEKGSKSKWINTLTKNLAINFSKKKNHSISFDEGRVHIPKEKNFSEEHIRWILNQFGTLSNRQKEILHLKYFKKMKSIEIARQLNISPPTVSEHLNLALKTLRKRAKKQGLLASLLPWNENFRNNMEGALMSFQPGHLKYIVGAALIGSVSTGYIITASEDKPDFLKSIAANTSRAEHKNINDNRLNKLKEEITNLKGINHRLRDQLTVLTQENKNLKNKLNQKTNDSKTLGSASQNIIAGSYTLVKLAKLVSQATKKKIIVHNKNKLSKRKIEITYDLKKEHPNQLMGFFAELVQSSGAILIDDEKIDAIHLKPCTRELIRKKRFSWPSIDENRIPYLDNDHRMRTVTINLNNSSAKSIERKLRKKKIHNGDVERISASGKNQLKIDGYPHTLKRIYQFIKDEGL